MRRARQRARARTGQLGSAAALVPSRLGSPADISLSVMGLRARPLTSSSSAGHHRDLRAGPGAAAAQLSGCHESLSRSVLARAGITVPVLQVEKKIIISGFLSASSKLEAQCGQDYHHPGQTRTMIRQRLSGVVLDDDNLCPG